MTFKLMRPPPKTPARGYEDAWIMTIVSIYKNLRNLILNFEWIKTLLLVTIWHIT